ncbi:MAG: helix-turn-helix transcriptional regulator [Clostridia bacterium]|nr:helix-turn-helix transcriptional regulator [Clostridia bacterium]
MSIDIKQKRIEHGFTLEQLGKIVGVSKSTIKKWESGYIKNMKRDKVFKLASALSVSPLELLNIPETSSTEETSITLNDEKRLLLENILNISISKDTVIYFTDSNAHCYKFPSNVLHIFKNICNLATPD